MIGPHRKRVSTPRPHPNVLLATHDLDATELLHRQLASAGCSVNRASTVSECLLLLDKSDFDLVLLEVSLKRDSEIRSVDIFRLCAPSLANSMVVLICSCSPLSIDQVNAALRVGAREIVELPLSNSTVERLVQLAGERHAQTADNGRFAANELQQAELCRELVGNSPSMAALRQLILEVAPTRVSVMIYGEGGTGKQLVAHAIHRYSKQAAGPFIPVNMAAVPAGMAESLLFGHDEAINGTVSQNPQGWCVAADGGTLFLDEVADMEIQVQPKMLRFLQEGTIQPVGSQVARRVDVRVIAATNHDPDVVIHGGRMREDLFFRLHVVPVYVPPLRDRPEDIPVLAKLFLRRAARRHERTVEEFSDAAMRVLEQHDWPGNVRQLENAVERIVIFSRGKIVEADEIPADDHLASAYADRRRALCGLAVAPHALTPIQRHERAAIVDALRRADGHVIDAARLIGLGQATIYRKIKQYSIPHPRKRRLVRPT
jgi:DNA-binding NtrC family response regulator